MNHPYNMNDFGMDYATTSMVNSNMNDVHISAGNDVDLLYFRNPICPQCMSHNIVKNGTGSSHFSVDCSREMK